MRGGQKMAAGSGPRAVSRRSRSSGRRKQRTRERGGRRCWLSKTTSASESERESEREREKGQDAAQARQCRLRWSTEGVAVRGRGMRGGTADEERREKRERAKKGDGGGGGAFFCLRKEQGAAHALWEAACCGLYGNTGRRRLL